MQANEMRELTVRQRYKKEETKKIDIGWKTRSINIQSVFGNEKEPCAAKR